MTTSVLLRRLTSRIEDFYKSQERVCPPLNWKWCALVILAVVCVLFARCPSAFLRPGMWCEDGRIFFLGAWNDGWRSLFIPYNKYLHLLTRAFALIGVHISADWIPEIYFLSWLFVLVCLEAFILRVSWLSNVERILFAFSVVLAPHRGETLYNLTNMHWYLSLGFFFLLLAPAVLLWFACACSIIVLQGAGHLSRKIHGYVPLRADRYFLVPYVIFCFTLVRLFARSSGRAMRSFSVCVTVVALTATTIPRFSIPEKPDVGWRGRMKSYRTRGHATFIDNSQRGDGRWEFELDSCQGGAKR